MGVTTGVVRGQGMRTGSGEGPDMSECRRFGRCDMAGRSVDMDGDVVVD